MTASLRGLRGQPSASLEFKKIDRNAMETIWPYLLRENGRTTDFSYAGILMWVDYFKYKYAIYRDTLFIKGVVENDVSKPAFSLPVGAMSLKESVETIMDYCHRHGIDAEFSAVPEYALEDFKALGPVKTEELTDWGDYLYKAELLATLSGKKMSKKRNHVNQFKLQNPDWHIEPLTADNSDKALAFMDVFDLEGDGTDMARTERALSRQLIREIADGNPHLEGAILYAGDKMCAYTIGDVKHDTLFVHVEKATRHVAGSYEMINTEFARMMTAKHPEISFINREDDAGDMGLRLAKESYHPLEVLKKYNIIMAKYK